MSVVYFVKPVDHDGPVKIGVTTLLDGRIVGLQTWSPVALEVVATIPGDVKLERRFHAQFADSRSHGEWFHWTPKLAETIEGIRSGAFDTAKLPKPVCINDRPRRRVARSAIRYFRDETLARDVLAFCRVHRIRESAFGRAATNDPALVQALRKGRNVRSETADRIRQFMATYTPETPADVEQAA